MSSKAPITADYLKLPCSVIVHPSIPNCFAFYRKMVVKVFFGAVRIYTPLFLLAAAFSKRRLDLNIILRVIPSIVRSSIFLVIQGNGYGMLLCTSRNLIGYHPPQAFMLCSFLAAFAAVSVEKKSRRIELAIYVLNQFLETVFRMGVSRGYWKPFKHGLTLVFALSMSILVYFYRHEDSCLGNMRGLMRAFLGVEGKKDWIEKKIQLYTEKIIDKKYTSSEREERATEKWGFFDIFLGFTKSFIIGFFLKQLLQLIRAAMKPTKLFSLLRENQIPSLKFGIALGLMGGGIKAIVILLRKIRGKDDGFNSAIAGFLAAFSISLFKSTDIIMYFAAKAVATLYYGLANRNLAPVLPFGESFAYALTTMVCIYCQCYEPHNLRPSYRQFMHKATASGTCHFDEVGPKLCQAAGIPLPDPKLFDMMKE
eukprot:TRINITY_DN9738_c0_g1_i1.p1 TRINITY_DN9738_c0_g1~~TRINITY_DN9738_c0_g1_i1.p1  ORF type:complete len:424 (+),score=39.66 TRINITY_DN9738_c0_g1_i1:70-1341(+)